MDGGYPGRLCAGERELCKRRDGSGVGADRAPASGTSEGWATADDPSAAGHGGLDELRTFGAAQLPTRYSHRAPLWVIVT